MMNFLKYPTVTPCKAESKEQSAVVAQTSLSKDSPSLLECSNVENINSTPIPRPALSLRENRIKSCKK